MWETVATIASPLIAFVGLSAGWLHWRRLELRRDDVLAWSNQAIEEMQKLVLICSSNNPDNEKSLERERLSDIYFRTSILVEQGRLFFRNVVSDDHGHQKETAYRGYRPEILDSIVVCHQIAGEWSSTIEDEKKTRMRLVAEDCLRVFVSLAQKEVGRSRTASADAGMSGEGAHLRDRMSNIDAKRLERAASS